MSRARTIALLLALLAAGGCEPAAQRLEFGTLSSTLLAQTKRFGLLRPPAALARDDLPVIVLLHGFGDDESSLDSSGVSERIFRKMALGDIPPAYLVMPDGDRGFYMNWHDGSYAYEDYVIHEVIPAAEAALGVAPKRDRRHLVGVSMGGIGALQSGLRHPELFASTASLSGPILDREAAIASLDRPPLTWFLDLSRIYSDGTDAEFFAAHNPFAIARRRAPDLGLDVFLAAGSQEDPFFRDGTKKFHELLVELEVPHRYQVFPGGHNWQDWSPVLEQVIARAAYRDAPASP